MGGAMTPDGVQPPGSAADSLAQHVASQRDELSRDQRIGRRAALAARLWFLVVVPLGLVGTAFLSSVRPWWPIPAAAWASGPVAALVMLWICRSPSRQPTMLKPNLWSRRAARQAGIQLPMVTYTGQVIGAVTSVFSVFIMVLGGIGGYLGSREHARDVAQDWHVIFAMLPALALAIVVLAVVHRMQRRGAGRAGAA